MGYFSTAWLKITEQRLLHLCQLSYAWTISRQILQRFCSDRYHIELEKYALAFLVNFVSLVPLGPTTRFRFLFVVFFVMPYTFGKQIFSEIVFCSCIAALCESQYQFQSPIKWTDRERSVRTGRLRVVSILSGPIFIFISHKRWPREASSNFVFYFVVHLQK